MTRHYSSGSEDMVRRRIKRVALSPAHKTKISFAWQNPEDKKIIVTGVELDVTTIASEGAIMNVGTSANATTDAKDLINSGNINALGVICSPSGTTTVRGKKMDEKGGTTDYITGYVNTQNANTLAGYAYVSYQIVES